MVNRKRALALLFLFVFVDVLGFSLILPLLPYYAATFGASAEVVGLLLDGKEWLNDWRADDPVENPYGSYDSVVDLTDFGEPPLS